jgi:spoIIIJ-associated protein
VAYVEVKAKTVELAIEAAMRELGVDDRDRLEVNVLQEPERGFLGMGGRDAIVKVTESAGSGSRRSGGGRRKQGSGRPGKGSGDGGSGSGGGSSSRGNSDRGGQRSGGGRQQSSGGGGSSKGRSGNGGGGRQQGNERQGGGKSGSSGDGRGKPKKKEDDRDELGVTSQEPLVKDFLTGLVSAFGLEGTVETRIEEDVIVAEVLGDQTEALVGPRGSVMESVHELTKTVLQRTAQDSARVRLDVAGYAERRRQALSIYAEELISQVVEDGGEVMLEPMSASDRKVIHDAVAANERVRSYSEGESPKRYVVIALVDGDDEDGPAADGGEEE